MPSPRRRATRSCSLQARSLGAGSSWARLAASACSLAFVLAPAQLAAQEGAAAGMATAQEPVDLPDAADPVFTGEQNEGLPQAIAPVPGAEPVSYTHLTLPTKRIV